MKYKQITMTTFTSFNDTCFCLDDHPCSLMTCGHACHPTCLQSLTVCPWCRAEICFIQPSVQKTYLSSKQVNPQPLQQPPPPQPLQQPPVQDRPPPPSIDIQLQERRVRAAQQQRARRMRLKEEAQRQMEQAAQLAEETRIKTIQWQMEMQRQQEAKRLKQREAARKYRAKKAMKL